MSGENKEKKRENKRKALRLANEASRNRLMAKLHSQVGDCKLRIVRTKDGVAFGVQSGLFGFDQAVVLPIPDEAIVGAVENPDDLAGIVTKVGILAVAKLTKYNLANGLDGLAKHLATWASIDLSKLEKDAGYSEADVATADAALDAQKITAALMATDDVEDLNAEDSQH